VLDHHCQILLPWSYCTSGEEQVGPFPLLPRLHRLISGLFRYSHLNRSSSSKRASSPSGSTISSMTSEEPSSPADLQDISPTDLDQGLAINSSLPTSPASPGVDPIEMVTDSPGSPDSQSSAGPSTPNVDSFDGKLLESLLQDLSPHTDLSDFKPSEFSFPFGSEATTIADTQTAPSFGAANLSCMTSPSFAAPSDQCMRFLLVCLCGLTIRFPSLLLVSTQWPGPFFAGDFRCSDHV
jgi:hypothetical protein